MTGLIRAVSNSELEEMQNDWRYKAILATAAHQSPLGGILLSVLGLGRNKLPRFGETATIRANGIVYVDFWERNGTKHTDGRLCPIEELRDSFRYLADEIGCSDRDREKMFDLLRKWIAQDLRSPGGRVVNGELLPEGA